MKRITLIHKESKASEEFTQAEITIGRSKDCNFTTPETDTRVSRHHCTIIQDEKGTNIKDHSTNGTTIGKLKLKKNQQAPLSDGDTIQLGSHCILKVSIKDDDNKSHKPAPIDKTPPKKEEELKLTPPDDKDKIDDFSDSALGLDENDDKNEEPLPMPSASEIENDLAKSAKEEKKKK